MNATDSRSADMDGDSARCARHEKPVARALGPACLHRRGRHVCVGRDGTEAERASTGRACRCVRYAPGAKSRDRLRLRRGQGVRGHGGYPPSQGGSALSHRERDEDVHGHDRAPARAGGDASASRARWKSTCRASFQGARRSRSGTCSVTARGSRTSRTTRNGSSGPNGRPRPVRSTPCALRPPSRWRSGPAARSAIRTRTTSRSVS